ncbi:hypothetical protein [Psychroserpens mesophilus]|uniref:hypothetical protein n=1 Tax=Psychroserpens mesophilus TaxID=325473 RepID=UPI003D65E2CC
MKTMYRILALTVLIFSFSCKNKSSEQTTSGTKNPMNEELTNTRNYEDDGNFREDVYTFEHKTDSINENWNLDNPERQERLYSRFDMTKNQQERYEKELQDWWTSDDNNPYDKMSTDKRIEFENDVMKHLLEDEQYERYKAWADNNDKR